ncbi:MAG: PIN domain-containing protein [Prevotellaceae bacterium]|jgi:predicted nucleic acid-binding protein|nr:PIN domain-containing protein [Prevotellaceae bacterium]
MIRALVDTNVVIDTALERAPFYEDANAIFRKFYNGELLGYISASAATDIFYVLRKERGTQAALKMLRNLVKILDILLVDRGTVHAALASDWSDFEDAVQAQVALENGIDIIVTRNAKDYKAAGAVKILTPPDFIGYLDSLR